MAKSTPTKNSQPKKKQRCGEVWEKTIDVDVSPQKSRLSSDGGHSTLTNTASTCPETESMALMGIHYDPAYLAHPDGVRASKCQALYNMHVYGFAKRNLTSTPTQLDSDLRSLRAWWYRKSDVDTVARRNTTIAILDHYWIENTYFDSKSENGYGSAWCSRLIPEFFKRGGKVMLMPNDRWGNVKRLWLERNPAAFPDMCACYLTLDDAKLYHPLWVGTDVAVNSEEWNGVIKSQQHRTNELALNMYLEPQNPFIMFYNVAFLKDEAAAFELLNGVRKLPLKPELLSFEAGPILS